MTATDVQAMVPSHSVPPRPLIEGPPAWIGAEMRKREAEWSYRLSSSEIAEIETAVQAVRARGLDLAEIRRDDFPLPTLGPVLDRLRGEVLDGRRPGRSSDGEILLFHSMGLGIQDAAAAWAAYQGALAAGIGTAVAF